MIVQNNYDDGSAAIVTMVERDNNRVIIANSGDQRAVLCRGGSAIQLTTDHKPDDPNEILRIQSCGGYVTENKRVDGVLALSRALGDNYLQPHVTYEPELYFIENVPEDKFIILACDGLWDVVTNQQAVDIVQNSKDAVSAAAALRDLAHSLGSLDNISVIVYFFQSPTTTSSGRTRKIRGLESTDRISKSQSKNKGRVKTMEIDPLVLQHLDYSSHI